MLNRVLTKARWRSDRAMTQLRRPGPTRESPDQGTRMTSSASTGHCPVSPAVLPPATVSEQSGSFLIADLHRAPDTLDRLGQGGVIGHPALHRDHVGIGALPPVDRLARTPIEAHHLDPVKAA